MNVLFASEVLNGNWAILCIVLAAVSVVYLVDEYAANGAVWTVGMRAARAVLMLTIGIGVLRISEYVSWHLYGTLYHQNTMSFRMAGGAIGVLGFLMSIKEFSRRLYGDIPWVIAVILMIWFTVVEIVIA